ncbi:MAG: hypothetical protein AAFR03_16475 [Pseudomonadota bacterium]
MTKNQYTERPVCARCFFFQKFQGAQDPFLAEHGECHRWPPAVGRASIFHDDGTTLTHRFNWCGEFKGRAETIAKMNITARQVMGGADE